MYKIMINYINGDVEDIKVEDYESFKRYKDLFKKGIKSANANNSFGINIYSTENGCHVTRSYNAVTIRRIIFVEPELNMSEAKENE